MFPTLSDDELRIIGNCFIDKDIKESLFSIGGLKAPEKDGIEAIFYQHQWDTVSADLSHSFHRSTRSRYSVAIAVRPSRLAVAVAIAAPVRRARVAAGQFWKSVRGPSSPST
ncbi:hypothetical protein PIB30_006125 [Stylosanthes scabra]|uniref:Uncharacterized protein n=1 Tax=Stylosanthes scabra TaxID=79078 RepID=A0ABU6W7E9_9FABA|nr:hypothetical protein [Stylosanthes scabra]